MGLAVVVAHHHGREMLPQEQELLMPIVMYKDMQVELGMVMVIIVMVVQEEVQEVL